MTSSSVSDSPKNIRRAVAVVAVCIVAYVLLILYNIAPYGFNISSMIRVGTAHHFFDPALLEPGLVVFNDPQSGGVGYDGQFYYYTVKDFFMGEDGKGNPFRSQRILYPLLSYALAFGNADALPYSMPAVNLLAIAISALLLWRLFGEGGAREETLALYVLNIGFLIAVFFDVATPLCVSLAVAGVYYYFRKMPWPAASMLALAMLAQENAVIVIASLCVWLVSKRKWRTAFILASSMLPWAIWQAVLWGKYGALPMRMSGGHFTAPFLGMISQVASLHLPGGWIGNLRALSVYPFMVFVLMILIVGVLEMKKKPSELNLILIVHALVGVCFNQEQIWGSTITSPARALCTVFPFIVLCYARQRSAGIRLLIVASVVLTLMGVLRIFLLPAHPYYVTP